MIRGVYKSINSRIVAKDGYFGKIADVFLDGEKKKVQYVVVETGDWLNHIRLVIPQRLLAFTDQKEHRHYIPLVRDQILRRWVKGTIGGYIPYGRGIV